MYQTKKQEPIKIDHLNRFPNETCVMPFFQPVVHIHSGHLFGITAWFSGYRQAGLEKKTDLFETAWKNGIQHQVDLCLRQNVFTDFFRFRQHNPCKLFLRLDHRACRSPDYFPGHTLELLTRQGLTPADVCFELSAHCGAEKDRHLFEISDRYRFQGFQTMLTNFDIRSCGLDYLDRLTPDYIRIDRSLFSNMKQHPEKKQILSFLITYSHLKECRVLACDGRNKEEFTACREMGCDLVQGNLVQPPQQ
ncbi:MAG TPA: EAL domain-containing protein, partial [Desulfotignum sp.]|nr:EAL domain-containing protein [Desulfotignum sp.]